MEGEGVDGDEATRETKRRRRSDEGVGAERGGRGRRREDGTERGRRRGGGGETAGGRSGRPAAEAKHEAWRGRRRRKVGPRPRSGGERSRCEASEGRGEKGRAGVEQPGARKGVLAAGRRLRAAGCWLLAVAVGCWRVGCWRAAAAPLADRWPLPAVGCCERASRRQRLDQGQHGERRGK